MNVIYASCLISQNAYQSLFQNTVNKPGQQAQKYHRLLAEGFAENGAAVHTISAAPITQATYRKLFYRRKRETASGVAYRYIATVNLPIIKNLLIMVGSFFRTLGQCLSDRSSVVVCDVLNISVAAGALIAAKVTRRTSIGIVTDIPEMQQVSAKKSSLWLNNKVMRGFSGYILLTQQMNERINHKDKPYVVVEGHSDIGMAEARNELENKYDQRVCLYAGALHVKYGIKMLVDAFLQADIKDAALHIYGSGDYEDELKRISQSNNTVNYFGTVANEVVVAEQLKATLLINPRPSHEEFTKYSFPSKNMEYMASGTPALTAKLPGMPEEYKDYVYIFKDESTEGLAQSLSDVLAKSKEELHAKGLAAKVFVLEHKNNVAQAKNIGRLDEMRKHIGEQNESTLVDQRAAA